MDYSNIDRDLLLNFSWLLGTNNSLINDHLLEEVDAGQASFFETYFSVPRFATETVLAIISAICNLLALGAVYHTRGRQTAYHLLFFNLAVANILSCILSWLCNNVLFLFQKEIDAQMETGTSLCEIFVFLLAGVFASSSFGLVSTLTMLGFSSVQYFAICKPLHHQSIVRKKKICIFITCTWSITLAGAFIPFIVLINITKNSECDPLLLGKILDVIVFGSNISIGVVGAAYITIVCLCLIIYAEIRSLQKRLSQFRFDQDMSSERKSFITIVILLTTLTVFFIPYAVVYVVSLNKQAESAMENKALIYYMNLLPYVKFFSDPIIYGMRMQEVREGWRRMLVKFGITERCRCCVSTEFVAIQQTSQSHCTSVVSFNNTAAVTSV